MGYQISARRGSRIFATHRRSAPEAVACGRELAAEGWLQVTVVGRAGAFPLDDFQARAKRRVGDAAAGPAGP